MPNASIQDSQFVLSQSCKYPCSAGYSLNSLWAHLFCRSYRALVWRPKAQFTNNIPLSRILIILDLTATTLF
jgi:hypothetical protein